jgi:hypothetical protein
MLANSFLQITWVPEKNGELYVNVAYWVDKLFFVAKTYKKIHSVCSVISEFDSDAPIFFVCCYLNS